MKISHVCTAHFCLPIYNTFCKHRVAAGSSSQLSPLVVAHLRLVLWIVDHVNNDPLHQGACRVLRRAKYVGQQTDEQIDRNLFATAAAAIQLLEQIESLRVGVVLVGQAVLVQVVGDPGLWLKISCFSTLEMRQSCR